MGDTRSRTAHHLIVASCFIIIAGGLKLAGDLLTPLLVALFFAVLCVPPMNRLKRLGVPEGIAITIVVVFATLLFLLVSAVVGRSLAGFQKNLPEYKDALDVHLDGIFGWMESKGIDMSAEEFTAKINSGAILNLMRDLATQLLAALSQIFLVVLTMIFMLVEASGFPNKMRLALGNPNADLSDWKAAMDQVQHYVAIKAGISAATGLLATLITAVVGVDFPLLWGLIAFLFNFIPNIGSVIAAIPPMLLALVQHGVGACLGVGIGYFVLNMIMGNVVEPRMMGRRLGLSTLVVFLSLIFWNWIWGPVGMVLSVPLTVILKIVLEHSDDFRWLAVILGADPGEDRAA